MCCNSPHTSWNSGRSPRSSSPPKVQVVSFCKKNDLQLGACLKSWKVKLVVSSSSTSKLENSNPDLPGVQSQVSASSEVHLLYVRILLKPRIQTPRELLKSVGQLYKMQAFDNCTTAQGIWTYDQVSPCVRCCKCQLRFNLGKPGQLSTVVNDTKDCNQQIWQSCCCFFG